LRGANLGRAQLLSVNLNSVDLADSTLDETFVFGTNITAANLATAAVRSVHTDQVKDSKSLAEVEVWIVAATQFAAGDEKENIAQRLYPLRKEPSEQDKANIATWKSLEDSYHLRDPNVAQHRQRLAKLLGDLACKSAGKPYVARGLIDNGRLEALGDQLEGVRERLQGAPEKPNTCQGVAGFTEDDWRRLKGIEAADAAHADPRAPP
jgi:hypothetical protein